MRSRQNRMGPAIRSTLVLSPSCSGSCCSGLRSSRCRAQALGFTLSEIRELLTLSTRRDVGRVKRAAEEKLADVEQRIASLRRIRQGLGRLIDSCPGNGRAEDCPILNALGNEELQ